MLYISASRRKLLLIEVENCIKKVGLINQAPRITSCKMEMLYISASRRKLLLIEVENCIKKVGLINQAPTIYLISNYLLDLKGGLDKSSPYKI